MAWKMRQTEAPFYGNLVHGAIRGSSLWVLLQRGSSVGSSLISIFSICLTSDPSIEKKRCKWFMFHLSAWNKFRSAKSFSLSGPFKNKTYVLKSGDQLHHSFPNFPNHALEHFCVVFASMLLLAFCFNETFELLQTHGNWSDTFLYFFGGRQRDYVSSWICNSQRVDCVVNCLNSLRQKKNKIVSMRILPKSKKKINFLPRIP